MSNWHPETIQQQDAWLEKHPMEVGYLFPTPCIDSVCETVVQYVRLGAPCCVFVGAPRLGKTRASIYLEKSLTADFPKFHVVRFICTRESSSSVSSFLNSISLSIGGLPVARNKEPLVSLSRRWLGEAARKNARRIVLIADELGRLTVNQLTTLADLTNLLVDGGFPVTTISFGSVEVDHLKSMVTENGRKDLIGRFFSRIFEFNGIRSEDELARILENFDDPAHSFPKDSGCCFTRFFLPRQYNAGFRLVGLSKDMWEHFFKLKMADCVVGAEHAFFAAETFLRRTRSTELVSSELIQINLAEAVKDSGFADWVGVVGS